MILYSSLQLLTSKHYRSRCRSRWENLDRGQYPFQPIKFVNLVVPSPCETEPHNKWPGGVRHDPQRVLGKNVEIARSRPSEHLSRLTVKSNRHPNFASFSESCH